MLTNGRYWLGTGKPESGSMLMDPYETSKDVEAAISNRQLQE